MVRTTKREKNLTTKHTKHTKKDHQGEQRLMGFPNWEEDELAKFRGRNSNISDVLNYPEHSLNTRYSVQCSDCLNWLRTLPDDSVDMVMGSPPYEGKLGKYGQETLNGMFPRRADCEVEDWSSWMTRVTIEACRVSKGYVFLVVKSGMEKSAYVPAVEMLICKLYSTGVIMEAPLVWQKNSPPSGGDRFFRDSYETIIAARSENVPEFHWERIAEVRLRKNASGAFRQRDASGNRRTGKKVVKLPGSPIYPHNVIYVTVGGNHMGSELAHHCECPYPEMLSDVFVAAFTEPGDVVGDCFAGSGTTLASAIKQGRRAIGCDLRESMATLTLARLSDLTDSMVRTFAPSDAPS